MTISLYIVCKDVSLSCVACDTKTDPGIERQNTNNYIELTEKQYSLSITRIRRVYSFQKELKKHVTDQI